MRRNAVHQNQTARRVDWLQIRIVLLGCLLALALLGLWARAFYVQIVLGPDLTLKAYGQHWTSKSTYGQRGKIVDAKGNLLAKSVPVNSVFVRPREIVNPQGTVQALHKILGLSAQELKQELNKDSAFVWLARKISDRKASAIQRARLQGVYLTEEKARFYPQGPLAGQLLGFVGVDNTGLEGLENSYNEYLAGHKKEFIVQRDASGNLLFAPGQLSSNLAGEDLILTLDKQIQNAAEQALAEAVRKNQAKQGMCLAVEVSTGQILAWAHYPFFNPNNYQQSHPSIWKNRIALDVFEPGSTIKPLLVAAALDTLTIRKQDIFFCENGEWDFAGQEFQDTHEYAWLPVNKIIRYSSNIGAAKIGLQLGAQRYWEYLQAMGLGRRSDLPLPGEARGILRNPEQWTQVDLVAASFGQGIGLTALQLAQMYLCLANQGQCRPLQIVKTPASSRSGKGIRVFSPRVAQSVLKMMTEVVEEDGTGTRARLPGMLVGGKTGTSQTASKQGGYADRYTASFVGFFPGLNPQYMILVVVDEPKKNHYGGVVAAPAVRRVAGKLVTVTEDFVQYWDDRSPEPQEKKGDASLTRVFTAATRAAEVRERQEPGTMPDLRGLSLRRATELLMKRSIVPRISGQGVVVGRQKPAPGTVWGEKASKNVRLHLVEG